MRAWILASVVSGAVCLLAPVGPGQAQMFISDNNDAVGTLGDTELSLDECIKLANGDIGLGSLSPQEKKFVIGVPGAGVADVIGYSFTAFPGYVPVNSAVTPLRGGNDTFDATLSESGTQYSPGQNGVDGGGAFAGLSVQSSNTTIFGVGFQNFQGVALQITAATGGATLGVVVDQCQFSASDIAIEIVGPGGAGATVGDSASPILVTGSSFMNINTAGANSRAIRVLGGFGDTNQVHAVVDTSTGRFLNGAGFEIVGGTRDIPGVDGDGNSVTVVLRDSTFSFEGFSGQAAGAIIRGADPIAATATGNTVSFQMDHATLSRFKLQGLLIQPGAGANHQLDVDLLQSVVGSCTLGGVVVQLGEGNNSSVDIQALGTSFGNNKLACVDLRGLGGPGTGQSVSFESINCWYDTSDRALQVGSEKNATFDVDFQDNIINGASIAGLELKPTNGSATYDLKVQGNAFRGCNQGIVVQAGNSTTFQLDAGGGPLGSRGNNTFENSTGCGIDNMTSTVVAAINNDYGDATGPSDCDPADADGIPDPTGSGDGVGEYVTWSPFKPWDQNPELVVTGSFNPPTNLSFQVDHGVPSSPFVMWVSLGLLNPPPTSVKGNHFYLAPPLFKAWIGTTGVTYGPFAPPSLPAGLEVYFQCFVAQTGPGELTNFVGLR